VTSLFGGVARTQAPAISSSSAGWQPAVTITINIQIPKIHL